MSIQGISNSIQNETLNRPNFTPDKAQESTLSFNKILNNVVSKDQDTNKTNTSPSSAVQTQLSNPISTISKTDPIQIRYEGNSLVIKIDPSISGNLTINVSKNPDNTFSINVIDNSKNTNQSNSTSNQYQANSTTNSTLNTSSTNVSQNTSTQPVNPQNNTTQTNGMWEEWMIPGRDYSNPEPAYSPVTGKPLNISVGRFYAMMDRNSWNPITKTHSATPTGQSWKQFKDMLEAGLDPYVTMFY